MVPSTLDIVPSTLDPRQKPRLYRELSDGSERPKIATQTQNDLDD